MTPALHNFFFFFRMPCWYIFYIELVGFCDVINIKGVKWVFRYLGDVNIKKNKI